MVGGHHQDRRAGAHHANGHQPRAVRGQRPDRHRRRANPARQDPRLRGFAHRHQRLPHEFDVCRSRQRGRAAAGQSGAAGARGQVRAGQPAAVRRFAGAVGHRALQGWLFGPDRLHRRCPGHADGGRRGRPVPVRQQHHQRGESERCADQAVAGKRGQPLQSDRPGQDHRPMAAERQQDRRAAGRGLPWLQLRRVHLARHPLRNRRDQAEVQRQPARGGRRAHPEPDLQRPADRPGPAVHRGHQQLPRQQQRALHPGHGQGF